LLSGTRSTAAAVADAGLRVADLGPPATEKAMQGACAVERERLESRLAFLGTLGNNAPFVGLFGTVIGVIQAFEQLGVAPTAGAGQAVSQAVMAGIAEALIATAVGIGVALPAVAFYNYFQRRIARLLSGTEALTSVVMAYLLAETPASVSDSSEDDVEEVTDLGETKREGRGRAVGAAVRGA
jgi:biopolymer transport protein ExbB